MSSPDRALESRVHDALATVIDPELRRPLPELGMIGGVSVVDGRANVAIRLTITGCPAATTIERNVRDTVSAVPGITDADITVGVMTPEQRRELTERLRGRSRTMPFGPESLTRVIAVTSGKGGVGKSTVTANLASALAARGRNVGIIDADVHGFSIPGLLGLVDANGRATAPSRVGDMIVPPRGREVATISIGMFLDDPDATVAWRGPMLHRTLEQFLTDVHFGDLDFLFIDLPPGTGDIAISLGQLLPHAEVIVVTTPQKAAADVAVRSGLLAKQSGQRLIGVIENMASATLADGTQFDVFGAGGGQRVADLLTAATTVDVPLLASVPLSTALRRSGDSGLPVVLDDPTDPASREILNAVDLIAGRGRGLAGRPLGVSPM